MKQHFEARDGEMWLTNESDLTYDGIGYKTKRFGMCAIGTNGEIINNLYPVFIQISEYNEVQNEYTHNKI